MRLLCVIAMVAGAAATARAASAPDPSLPFDLNARKTSHWCWKPVRRQALPDVNDARWPQSPIDRFILASLEKQGLAPSPQADRRTLIRRAYFDLIGLPPTPADVEAFVNDSSSDAFAQVVDRLLASDQFGERWARHWLDLVRYAETRGHEFDPLIPNAWQYRDYVVRALNADVPYDQFVTEQIAGDLLVRPRLNPQSGFNESILGTGFWFLGEEMHSPVDIRQDEADRLNNRIDTMTKAFLGLTVGCARCHDHKFDAISQKDFYALQGFVLSASYRQTPFDAMKQNGETAAGLASLRSASLKPLLKAQLAAERPALERVADLLLGARDVLLSRNPRAEAISAIAVARSLDAGMLKQWVSELSAARNEPSHALNVFAMIALDSTSEQSAGFSSLRNRFLEQARNHEHREAERQAPQQVILDFESASQVGAWRPDGVAYGSGPIAAGEPLAGNSRAHPIAGVALCSEARRDPAVGDLKPAPGTEVDSGQLGAWHRAGQSIRTPTVTLESGRLWYLVRGAGRAYAVVDSHLLVDGPLHGAVLRSWNAPKPAAWTWIEHDLTPYAGERCHVEFCPAGDGEFEVAKVIEGTSPPAIDFSNPALLAAASEASVDSVETLARAMQRVLVTTADRLATGTIRGSSDAHEMSALADWLVARSELFFTPGKSTAFDEQANRFIDAQETLARKIITESATAPAMWEGNGVDETVLIRGVAKTRGDVVPRRFLEAIKGANQKPYPADGSGRLQLAADMLAEDDPLISRVIVNRIWQHLFGRGIVPTVDNFGLLGERPTHPELLDFLADEFRHEQAWSIKKLVRSIMLSRAYQMSSKAMPAAEQLDPQNLLWSHMLVRRLEAEPIRDEILSVSGRLDPKIGGSPVEVHLTEFMDGRGKPDNSGPIDGDGRRSLYIRVRRNFLPPMMLAFDMPNPFACIGRRNVSNVPAQALILMNDPMVNQQAALWAKHVLAEPGKTVRERICGVYARALGRPPSERELADAVSFLDQQGEAYGLSIEQRTQDPRPWTDFCQVIFNLKEFIFIE